VNRTPLHSITQLLQVLPDCLIEPTGFNLLLVELRHQPLHPLLERFVVFFLLGGADVAAGDEDVAVLADFIERGRFAETGDVAVDSGTLSRIPPQRERVVALPAAVHLGPDWLKTTNHAVKSARAMASSVSLIRRFSSILSSSVPRLWAMASCSFSLN
jgi:hypothetical protein